MNHYQFFHFYFTELKFNSISFHVAFTIVIKFMNWFLFTSHLLIIVYACGNFFFMAIVFLSVIFSCQAIHVLSCSVVSDSLWPHGLWPARVLCPWDSPAKNTGVGCHALSRGSSQPRDQTQVYCIAGGFFTIWASREALLFF